MIVQNPLLTKRWYGVSACAALPLLGLSVLWAVLGGQPGMLIGWCCCALGYAGWTAVRRFCAGKRRALWALYAALCGLGLLFSWLPYLTGDWGWRQGQAGLALKALMLALLPLLLDEAAAKPRGWLWMGGVLLGAAGCLTLTGNAAFSALYLLAITLMLVLRPKGSPYKGALLAVWCAGLAAGVLLLGPAYLSRLANRQPFDVFQIQAVSGLLSQLRFFGGQAAGTALAQAPEYTWLCLMGRLGIGAGVLALAASLLLCLPPLGAGRRDWRAALPYLFMLGAPLLYNALMSFQLVPHWGLEMPFVSISGWSMAACGILLAQLHGGAADRG